jgi:iron(III) transport system substrate-binding protein
MKRLKFLVITVISFIAVLASVGHAATAALDELIAAAKKEGVIEFYAPSTLTPEGAQKLRDAFNKKYGLNITVNYNPSGAMTRDVGKIVGFAAAGKAPEWDLMVVHDAAHATLWLKKLHKPFDYKKLGIDAQSIQYDSGTVIFANQFVLPAYNNKVLPPQDVPKSWDDLLNPKWKGGKLGMGTATHHLARLATLWGEEKTTAYVKGLAKQEPYLGELGTLYSRLQLGEILVAITMTDSFVHRAKLKGAPVVHAEGIEPVISPAYNAGVLKNALHPNAAHLFAAFFTTPVAQEIWETYGGQTSAFVPGTTAYKYAQGKKVIYMNQKQADMVDRLTRDYGKILGFK